MRNKKNKLDEMQEQKLLKIEHNGMWLAFWGLLIVMVVQLLLYGTEGFDKLIGEWVVFMCLAGYVSIGCMKNGIWDRKLEANVKTNLAASLIGGVLAGALFAVVNYRSFQNVEGAIATFVVNGIMMFVLCFAGLSVAAYLYKKKVAELEQEDEE